MRASRCEAPSAASCSWRSHCIFFLFRSLSAASDDDLHAEGGSTGQVEKAMIRRDAFFVLLMNNS